MGDQPPEDPSDPAADEQQLPAALRKAIAAADAPPALLTGRVDRQIDALARQHFAPRQTNDQRRWRDRAVWGSLAATVLVVMGLALLPFGDDVSPQRIAAADGPLTLADVDGSGSVDIADVFALARQGQTPQPHLDLLALNVVALEQAPAR